MKSLVSIIIISISILVANVSYAQNRASATATVSVTIVKPLNIQQTSDLNFGKIPQNSGYVDVTSKDKRAGGFSVEGQPGAQINVTLPQNIMLYDHQGNKLQLISNDRAYNTDNNQNKAIRMTNSLNDNVSLNSQGKLYIWYGGKINSNGVQKGIYKGAYTATVAYVDQ